MSICDVFRVLRWLNLTEKSNWSLDAVTHCQHASGLVSRPVPWLGIEPGLLGVAAPSTTQSQAISKRGCSTKLSSKAHSRHVASIVYVNSADQHPWHIWNCLYILYPFICPLLLLDIKKCIHTQISRINVP